MISRLHKNALVKIGKSFGRYFSLFVVVMVGVGFFLGIRATSPDILDSTDTYLKAHDLADVKVVSTMGLTDSDVSALGALDGVASVASGYSTSALDQGKPIEIHELSDSVNTPELVTGRLPNAVGECVADSRKYSVGDVVKVTSDTDGVLTRSAFTVVGTVDSPLYLSTDYGTSMVGDGKLDSFIFALKDAFDLKAYSEIYIRVQGADQVAFQSEGYDSLVSSMEERIAAITSERERARYDEIKDDAQTKIDRNRKKLEDSEQSGLQKLASAKDELDANAAKLAASSAELDKKEAKLESSIRSEKKRIAQAREELSKARSELDDALAQAGSSEDQLPSAIDQLSTTISDLEAQLETLDPASSEYQQVATQLATVQAESAQLIELQKNLKALDASEARLDEGEKTFQEQVTGAREQIAAGREKITSAQEKIDEGYATYAENLSAFKQEIADAREKIDKAQQKLDDMETVAWHVSDRDAIPGYTGVKTSTSIIENVASILPLFFILLVILMTSNTMIRMIAEERGELGTLSSLGFRNRQIIGSYMLYVLSATLLGAVAGFFVGAATIPFIIFGTFSSYILPPLSLSYELPDLLVSLLVVTLLMGSVTLICCMRELRLTPADLMRPVPPAKGKTILLERIGFIWRHLSFSWKVTMRNIFRYRQRVLMTVICVMGCTALLICGFGLRDSISGVAERQYDDIFHYDTTCVLKDSTTSIPGAVTHALAREGASDPLLVREGSYSVAFAGDQELTAYLVSPADESLFSRYFTLTDMDSGSAASLDAEGALITRKMAQALGVKAGGEAVITDSDGLSYTVPVAGVVDNYLQNYVYMGPKTLKAVFGDNADYNTVICNRGSAQEDFASALLKTDQVASINYKEDALRQADEARKSLDGVVVLIVVIATMLVLIVLFNLTSINISEREREISTLKVLGFTDKESNQYIYREAFLLIILGILLGLLLGIPFLNLILDAIEGHTTVYFRLIQPMSYVWSCAIILVVAAIMQFVTDLKMKRIDMIGSLKSVE